MVKCSTMSHSHALTNATVGLDPLGHAASSDLGRSLAHPPSPPLVRWPRTLPLPTSYKWHATRWPGAISRNGGSALEQRGMASGQRVWNRHPLGGLSGDGISPVRTTPSAS